MTRFAKRDIIHTVSRHNFHCHLLAKWNVCVVSCARPFVTGCLLMIMIMIMIVFRVEAEKPVHPFNCIQ